MFTGLIETTGVINSVSKGNESLILAVTPNEKNYEVKVGDSVAINGVCLTIEKIDDNKLFFRAVYETVNRTTVKDLHSGSIVNLERAMLAGGRLDGHIVQGHIDTVAEITSIIGYGDSLLYTFSVHEDYIKYITSKGSVAIDGISLTIAESLDSKFTVSLIPYSIDHTALKGKKIGDRVNIECDVLARYIEQLINSKAKPNRDNRIMELLERNGF